MSGFDWPLLAAPLAMGLLVVATHVTLGREVLARGIIFIDLTIAQIAALGVIAVDTLGVGEHPAAIQIAAGSFALVAALALAWTESRFHELQEALIGSLYIVAASAALLLLARNPHGAEHMSDLLAGQILWVGWTQVAIVAALYAPLLALWFLAARHWRFAFYLVFAIAVTASVQLVGVYLVFATLILPALAVQRIDGRRGLALGYGIGALGYTLGLALSVPFDLPSGPLVVVVLAALALATGVVRGLRRSPGRAASP